MDIDTEATIETVSERLPDFDDHLEPLGTVAGAFLVLVGLATLAGRPWRFSGDILISLVQLGGIAGTIAIGIAIVWLARRPS